MISPVMDTAARQRMAPPMPLRRRAGANAAIGNRAGGVSEIAFEDC